jgi:hypothetical protein
MWAVFVLLGAISFAPDSPARLSPERANLLVKYPSFTKGFQPERIKDEHINPKDLVPIEEYERDLARFRELNNKIDSYPHDLAMCVLFSLFVWALPLIAIYLLGMGAAWIRAGFRR